MKTRSRVTAMILAVLLEAEAFAADETDGYVLIKKADGDPVFASDALGQEVTFIYDENGDVVATIDQDGVVTDWQALFAEASAAEAAENGQ